MTEPLDDASTHWLPAGGYLLRLAGDAIIAADADGQPLPAVPAAATTPPPAGTSSGAGSASGR